MRAEFNLGDLKKHSFDVSSEDFASFETGIVHKVCSTFALGREMEWCSRQFVLEMIDKDEEGVGTFLEIKHISPAFFEEHVEVIAQIESFIKNELICRIEVKVGNRQIATGRTGQKILSKEKINQIFTSLER
jgi:fluoroacetyl-CoA thioesterase